MKKLLLVTSLLLALTGCSSSNDEPSEHAFMDELLTDNRIIVGTSPDYPPYESYNTDNEIVGFDIDMANAVINNINTKYGTEYVLELKPSDFGLIVGSLEAKQIDLGISGFTYDPARDVTFSAPYLGSRQVVVTREDTNITSLADLEGKKVAVQLGTTGAAAIETLGETMEFGSVESIVDSAIAFQSLTTGNYDAVVCDEAVADRYVAEFDFVKVEEALVDEQVSIILNKENTELAAVINEAIEEFVNSEEYVELQEKWGLAG